jgi:hypothetical protein
MDAGALVVRARGFVASVSGLQTARADLLAALFEADGRKDADLANARAALEGLLANVDVEDERAKGREAFCKRRLIEGVV